MKNDCYAVNHLSGFVQCNTQLIKQMVWSTETWPFSLKHVFRPRTASGCSSVLGRTLCAGFVTAHYPTVFSLSPTMTEAIRWSATLGKHHIPRYFSKY